MRYASLPPDESEPSAFQTVEVSENNIPNKTTELINNTIKPNSLIVPEEASFIEESSLFELPDISLSEETVNPITAGGENLDDSLEDYFLRKIKTELPDITCGVSFIFLICLGMD